MSAVLLDGKQLAQTMQAEIAVAVADFTRETGVKPGLAGRLPSRRLLTFGSIARSKELTTVSSLTKGFPLAL